MEKKMTNDIMSKVGTRLGNIDDLPEELKKQIPEFALGGLDEQVYNVLKENLEGIASLSEIMIALYQRYKVMDKNRQEVTEAVYRLIRKKVVVGVKGRKAVYKLTSLKVEENSDTDEQQPNEVDTSNF